MRWSKVRKLVEDSFASSVRGRLSLHSTSGRGKGEPFRCNCGWGWIAVDRQPIAWFDTHASRFQRGKYYHEVTVEGGNPAVPDDERHQGRLVEPGEFSRLDLHEACWNYLHSSLNESLASPNPLIASLAVLNARVGKNRLRRLADGRLHPLTRYFVALRLEAEGVKVRRAVSAISC